MEEMLSSDDISPEYTPSGLIDFEEMSSEINTHLIGEDEQA